MCVYVCVLACVRVSVYDYVCLCQCVLVECVCVHVRARECVCVRARVCVCIAARVSMRLCDVCTRERESRKHARTGHGMGSYGQIRAEYGDGLAHTLPVQALYGLPRTSRPSTCWSIPALLFNKKNKNEVLKGKPLLLS